MLITNIYKQFISIKIQFIIIKRVVIHSNQFRISFRFFSFSSILLFNKVEITSNVLYIKHFWCNGITYKVWLKASRFCTNRRLCASELIFKSNDNITRLIQYRFGIFDTILNFCFLYCSTEDNLLIGFPTSSCDSRRCQSTIVKQITIEIHHHFVQMIVCIKQQIKRNVRTIVTFEERKQTTAVRIYKVRSTLSSQQRKSVHFLSESIYYILLKNRITILVNIKVTIQRFSSTKSSREFSTEYIYLCKEVRDKHVGVILKVLRNFFALCDIPISNSYIVTGWVITTHNNRARCILRIGCNK